MTDYTHNMEYWDKVFKKVEVKPVTSRSTGITGLDEAFDWLCDEAGSILDFGCGNGVSLHYCALRGTKKHLGIDISEEGIRMAENRPFDGDAAFDYKAGGVETLSEVGSDSMDGVILMNIIDNLHPNDATTALKEISRILRPGGKVLVKLNPYLTEEQIKEYDIKTIEGNFLDDSLYLWNQTTEEWTAIFSKSFEIFKQYDVHYKEHDQYNRVFLLEN